MGIVLWAPFLEKAQPACGEGVGPWLLGNVSEGAPGVLQRSANGVTPKDLKPGAQLLPGPAPLLMPAPCKGMVPT